MLPGRDGLSWLRQVRGHGLGTPVLLLSARGEVNERVEGLNAGADDYLPKPFVIAELAARARVEARAAPGGRPEPRPPDMDFPIFRGFPPISLNVFAK
jgi:two-component system OmpR family response regulator